MGFGALWSGDAIGGCFSKEGILETAALGQRALWTRVFTGWSLPSPLVPGVFVCLFCDRVSLSGLGLF